MVNAECRSAGIGCVDCKKLLAENLNDHLQPFRARRDELDQNPEEVWEVLHNGAARARQIADQTIREAREAVGLP